MNKKIVVYFSAESGRTATISKDFAGKIGADIFEIVPEAPYTQKDLNYMNPLARCNREFAMKKDVPVAGTIDNIADYDTVYIGFPIWYGCAPLVVNTFCKSYDWSGKKIYIFATSGGSGIGKTAEKLKPYVSGAVIEDARKIGNAAELGDWDDLQ